MNTCLLLVIVLTVATAVLQQLTRRAIHQLGQRDSLPPGLLFQAHLGLGVEAPAINLCLRHALHCSAEPFQLSNSEASLETRHHRPLRLCARRSRLEIGLRTNVASGGRIAV